MNEKKSTIPKFYLKELKERQEIIRDWIQNEQYPITDLTIQEAETMIENVINTFSLPFAVATNFKVNEQEFLVPMVIEEPSVVAAVSNAAKLFRSGGGFATSSDPPIMIGQIQLLDITEISRTLETIEAHKAEILKRANQNGGSIIRLGGGAIDIKTHVMEHEKIGIMIIIHLLYDTRDAMGANAINTALETIAPYIEQLTNTRAHLKILSNLSDQRKAKATGVIKKEVLEKANISGEQIVQGILEAAAFAEIDTYRATTHNKGIMNGIDAVAIATGNDWRAIEAGAHAYAVRHGRYTSLTNWHRDEDGNLHGQIELPMAVGIIGGATRVHPMAQLALKILNIKSAKQLAEIMAAVGLAQNFAAMLALSTDGIQKGHMRMHARQLAAAAGAKPDQISKIAAQMISESNIRLERAKQIVSELEGKSDE